MSVGISGRRSSSAQLASLHRRRREQSLTGRSQLRTSLEPSLHHHHLQHHRRRLASSTPRPWAATASSRTVISHGRAASRPATGPTTGTGQQQLVSGQERVQSTSSDFVSLTVTGTLRARCQERSRPHYGTSSIATRRSTLSNLHAGPPSSHRTCLSLDRTHACPARYAVYTGRQLFSVANFRFVSRRIIFL